MPIADQYDPIKVNSNGSADEFIAVPDSWFFESDVVIESEGIEIPWNRVTGGVSLDQLLVAGVDIVVTRVTALLQNRDFETSGRLPGKEVASGLDRSTLIAQELDEKLRRSVQVEPGEDPISASALRQEILDQTEEDRSEVSQNAQQVAADTAQVSANTTTVSNLAAQVAANKVSVDSSKTSIDASETNVTQTAALAETTKQEAQALKESTDTSVAIIELLYGVALDADFQNLLQLMTEASDDLDDALAA